MVRIEVYITRKRTQKRHKKVVKKKKKMKKKRLVEGELTNKQLI